MSRRAAILLCLVLTGCTSNEAALQAAKADLEQQLAGRARLIAEAEALESYRVALINWRRFAIEQPAARPFLPKLPVSLEPGRVLPVREPALPPPVLLESSKSKQLRAEIAELLAKLRATDRQLSEYEEKKTSIIPLMNEMHDIEEGLVRKAQAAPFFPLPAGDGATPDAGTMRRVEP